jgi:hypothetical protein
MAGSSDGTFPTPSDGTYGFCNVKVEQDVDMLDVEEVNVKTENIIFSEEEECVDIKQEYGLYSEEEQEEAEDIDRNEEVSLKDTV